MYEYRAYVHSVHDGDTFRADVDLGFGVWKMDEAFRLNRINAPELIKADSRGSRSRDRLRAMIPVGSEVIIRTEKDKLEKYGRMLADVYVGTTSINDLLVKEGYALYWDGTGPRPV